MTFADLVSSTIGLINLVIPVLFALALVMFMWTAVRYVRQAGGEGAGEVREQLLWGLIALFVIFSIWGLINVLCYTFLGHTCSNAKDIHTGGANIQSRVIDLTHHYS